MSKKISVEIVGDASDLQRALKGAGKNTSHFGKIMKGVGLGVGAAMTGLGIAAKIGFDEFSQGQKVAAQTKAVLKSTGGAANVTAKHIDDLGLSIMKMSGLDDEAVKSGENLLLTFTGIRNEVGKGNDIFDRATLTMTNMSVALGQDMKSSAIQLGKALNDPVKGMTALQRVGVTFTDAQKEQVAAMVKTGDKLGAQKLILAELNKEFGGSAKAAGQTLPGQLAILRESFNNWAGDMVARALPAISTFVDFLGRVRNAKSPTIAIKMIASGAGDALQKILFGSPATRVKVPVDQRHFEWVVTGGGTGLVGAIAKAIRAINWTEVGTEIAQGMKQAADVAIPAVLDEAEATWRDKSKGWPGIIREGVEDGVNQVTHFREASKVLRVIFGGMEEDASASTGAIREHLALMGKGADGARVDIEQLRLSVSSLKSKKITVTANVVGLGYVAALQEHLSIIRNQGVNVNVTGDGKHRQHGGPVMAGHSYIVGEKRPELFVPNTSGRIMPRVPATAGRGDGDSRPIQVNLLLDGRTLATQLVHLDQRLARAGG